MKKHVFKLSNKKTEHRSEPCSLKNHEQAELIPNIAIYLYSYDLHKANTDDLLIPTKLVS